jgi:phage gpG-like protein
MGIRCTAQAKLDGLKKMIGVIAAKGWIGELAQRTAAAGMKLVGDEFRKQQDPYGKAWAPLKQERTRDKRARLRAIAKGRTPRGSKVLHKTGRMENSAGASASGRLVNVVVPVEYAAYHQNGAHIAPHSRLASYNSPTYRVGNRFVSEKDAKAFHKIGADVQRNYYNRTFANGITIPQRKILPDAQGGIPSTWQKMLRKESALLIAQKMGKRS